MDKPGMALYFAGRIYTPSYISLHTALSAYGLIPESVIQITSVTSLKTAGFSNDFGDYSYKSVRSDLMFGYEPRTVADGRTVPFATREKALLDLFYLYPFYNTRSDIADLRFDGDVLHEDLDCRLLEDFTARCRSAAVERRVRLFREVHQL
jgi:predicted transcriptional regulator of viral defense system